MKVPVKTVNVWRSWAVTDYSYVPQLSFTKFYLSLNDLIMLWKLLFLVD